MTIEIQPTPLSSDHDAAAEAPWSDQAVHRLLLARTLGLVLAIGGAAAFLFSADRSGLVIGFVENGGLTLLIVGLVTIAAAARTRGSAPARSFTPRPIVSARMWFMLLWLGGCGVAAVLLLANPSPTTEQVVMLILSTPLMVVGGLWLLNWQSGQLVRRWPLDPAVILRLAPSWTVIWSGVWGLFSTMLAFVIESAPVLLLAVLSGVAFTEVSRPVLTPLEILLRLINNPVLVIVVFVGAVFGAPIVEEAAKALGLRWLRPWIKHSADGWLLGMAAGLGFGVLEGAFNLDSPGAWFMGSWVRLATLLLHGLTTSLTGLGYARSIQSGQRGELWRGYRSAVIVHGLWNACALGLTFSAASAGMGAISVSPLLACGGLLLMAGLLVFMLLLIRRTLGAAIETNVQEGFQQAQAPLPRDWQPMKFNWGWRLVNRRPVEPLPEQPD
jgi:RsiW-degrading membrane proteinase PrsW (M82 family)